ncbi:endospore germination permease [Paenibacillus sp. TAB 01]|uniref:GerAB/ArcD/ProY family transporter n=1 Tax=Paenibacillus sp. TAB 01 TaxID=3368988 RepID=UPI003750DE16
MIPSQKGLNLHQLITLFMLSSGLMDHVIVMPFLLGTAGRSGWISVLIVGLLLTCWLPSLTYAIRKMNGQPVFEWVKRKYGALPALLLQAPVMIYVFAFGTVTLVDTVGWVKSMFLPETPLWFITIALMGVCVWAAFLGIRKIARCGIFLLPLVVLFGIFVSVANIPRKHYMHLLPILENGFHPVFKGIFIGMGGLIEVVLVLLLQHHLEEKLKVRHLTFILWMLVGLTAGPLIGAIVEFGPDEAARLRYPAYEEWRLVRIGHYVEHVDFLSIFQWLSGSFVRISLSLFLMKDLLRSDSSGTRASFLIIMTGAVLMTIIALLPFSDQGFVELLSKWYFSGTIAVALLFSIGLMLLTRFKMQERSGSP